MPLTYSCDITIAAPRERVVALANDREKFHEWQGELVSLAHLSGAPGREGARTALVYRTGGRRLEVVETITAFEPPSRICAIYEAANLRSEVESTFTETPEGNTRWQLRSRLDCSGLMRLTAILLPGSFRKQTARAMQEFKDFAEAC
jgi:uncharacterized protein YndB with AHSA1/START domain